MQPVLRYFHFHNYIVDSELNTMLMLFCLYLPLIDKYTISVNSHCISVHKFWFFRKSFSSTVTCNCTNSRDSSICALQCIFSSTVYRVLKIKNKTGA